MAGILQPTQEGFEPETRAVYRVAPAMGNG